MFAEILPWAWGSVAVKGSIILAGAGLVSLLMARASSAHRHLAWSAALICLPVITLLAVSGPAWRWKVLPPPATTVALVDNLPHQARSAPPATPRPMDRIEPTPADAIPSRIVSATPAPTHLITWIQIAWSALVLLTLLPLLVGILAVARIGRSAHPPKDDYWTDRVAQALQDLNIRRPVRLLEHDQCTMPMTWGVFRPSVLLPMEARTWTQGKQNAVLLHELAHVKRCDYVTRLLARLGLALHAFNPLAWFAWRRMHIESERACDDRVLAAGSNPAEYADHLLQIARRCLGLRWTAASAITMARKSQLEGRILAVLDGARDRGGIRRRRVAITLALTAGLVIPLSAIRLVAHEESPPTEALIPALEAKMQEVMLRRAENHAYKDKMSLDSVWEDYRERNHPKSDEVVRLITKVEAWAKVVVEEEGAQEAEYLWRLCHVLSVMAEDGGDNDAAMLWLERSLENYPHTVYSHPSKFSKFQHLANRLAGLRWTAEGYTAAEEKIMERFHTDPRFEYFFLPWWEQEAIRRDRVESVADLDQVVLAGYRQRLSAFPERAEITRGYMQNLAGEKTPDNDTDTIQARIDAAAPGDVVVVPAGQFDEPLRIDKALTLRGVNRSQSMLKVKADRPAIHVLTDAPVVIENLTIEWQLATSRKSGEPPSAVAARDGQLTILNCEFSGDAGPHRCPTAVVVSGFAETAIKGCVFSGFNFTVEFGGGAKGLVEDCIIVNPGHCGVTVGSGSEATVRRTLVTGSAYHGLRCTGGTLNAEDNVIIANKNRGIYLGNKAAHGIVRNNLIHGNATGISAFGGSDTSIQSNVLINNSFAAIDARSTCPIRVDHNILQGNNQGVVVWEEGGRAPIVKLGSNLYWQNQSNDVLRIELADGSVLADPVFADPANGDFSSQVPGHGLANPSAIVPVWKNWAAVRGLHE